MGRLIDQLAGEYNFDVALRLDSQTNANGNGINKTAFAGIDVAIEFSIPEAAPVNLKRLAEAGIPSVAGTTGWFAYLDEVGKSVNEANTGLVWSPNFSIGVAIFHKLVGTAAQLLREESYGAWGWEIHHDTKKDAPSGTLLRLTRIMEESGFNRPIDVASNRAGKHPGTHEIGFDSAADTITLRHTARNREGFARGALKAAQWIEARQGVFTFDEVLFGAETASKPK
jgi:4-hydroxy-tetrahydrodipicolinate reductase